VTVDLRPLAAAHTVLLETLKRDGSWVGTPVNPLVEDEHLFFRTWSASGKAKRLRNFPEVRLAPSTFRGRPTGEVVEGRAERLEGAEDLRVGVLIDRKYPVMHKLGVRLLHRLRGLHTQHYEVTFG
jgi:uncharacterized protein